jgi:hypothetical protein
MYIRFAFPLAQALPPCSRLTKALFDAVDCAFSLIPDTADQRMRNAGAMLWAAHSSLQGGRFEEALHRLLRIYGVSPKDEQSQSYAIFWEWADTVRLAMLHATCLHKLGRPVSDAVRVLNAHAKRLADVRAYAQGFRPLATVI